MRELQESLKRAIKDLFNVDVEPELTRPEEQFGDYSTNVAMQLAAQLGKSSREIAQTLADKVQYAETVDKTQVAGPGFINFFISDKALLDSLNTQPSKELDGKEILVEFGDPNPFKEMHIGHLYSYIVGDAIAGLLEASGATVRRLSYHGDVGLHVAKAVFGLRELKKPRQGQEEDTAIEKEGYLGKAYAYGAKKYEEDEESKEEIDKINLKIYEGDDPQINNLHQAGINLSFDYFDKILDLLSINNDKRYLESQTIPAGKELVEKNLDSVFKQSQGAIVYEGEKVGLHTRVFITSKGLPTYETKDLGLTVLKDKDYPQASRSIIITANEQSEYFKVMLAALAEINADLAKKTTHLSHGFLSLTTGKMSSRLGDVYPAMKLLLEVKAAVHEQYPDSQVRKEVTFGAVKYAFLKHRLGSDITIDIEESISLEGNSGPYLQYAFARANSILQKVDIGQQAGDDSLTLQTGERSLTRKLSEYQEVVVKATDELMPHHIATYLYELAQNFNRFYESSRIIGDEREVLRLKLVESYAQVLKNGLQLLNIPVVEKM
ncbi:MAG TPA: arginine--tRNA ligase [Candidatus Saccharimonadales bacterium]|nr:arginine--tRNA ligase [Candidatus Saccharimonadales bacterium]